MSSHNVLILYFRTVNVSVPKKTRNNGTLYAYIFLHHAGVLPWHDGKQVHIVSPLTTYMVPKPEEINLLTGESTTQVGGFSTCRRTSGKRKCISFVDACSVSICYACIYRMMGMFKKKQGGGGGGANNLPPFFSIVLSYTKSRPFNTVSIEPNVILAAIKIFPYLILIF